MRLFLLGAFVVCLAFAGVSAGTDEAPALESRRRFLSEQLRQFQLARQAESGAYVVKALDDRGLPLRPALAGFVKPPATVDTPFESLVKKTYQQLLMAPSACCLCSNPSTCDDGLFCNGAEICQTGFCAPGPPACADANPCTTDLCTETTDTCSFPPVPPPAEVASLNVSRSAPLSPVALLAWSGVSGASAYNVYRSASAPLGGLACFSSGVLGTSTTDAAVPPSAYYYLVTSRACGESSLGTGSPNGRPAPPGCP